jgi:glycosyltransferase involved in cell wall biosynthesis
VELGGPGLAGLNERNNRGGGGAPPLVTVLVCTHNDEATLPIALTSAIAQTAEPECYRILVVDDGSTDATPEEIERFRRREPDRLEVVRLERNVGLVRACNEGLARVRTPFYVRLDGDDRLDPELIEALLETSMLESATLVYTDRYEVHGDGSIRPRRLPTGDLDVGVLIAAGTLLPSRLVREVGGYREMFWEEFDLYLRLLESGRCRAAHIDRPLYTYTIGEPGRMTSDEEAVEAGWAELREQWAPEVLERYGLTPGVGGVPGRSAVAG